jgi:hypothetical protein
MAYIGKQPGTGVRNRFLYTATAGQTTFTTSDSNLALSYSDALYMDVYLNGVLLDPANDYTATSGTSVVLGSGATAGDVLEIVVYDVFSVFNNTIDGNFDVAGNTTLDNNVTVGGDLTITDKIVHSGDTNTAIRFSANDTVTVETAGNERVRVDSSGRVGIGTTSPNDELEVNGDIRALRSDSTTQYGIFGQDSSGGFITTHRPHASLFENFRFLASNNAGTEERMRITSTGNIQIGSTNSGVAGAAIDVSIGHTGTNGSGGITLFSPTDGTHSIGFADGTSGTDRYRGYVEYQHANDFLDFATSSTMRMRIDSLGQVIIGKTSASITTAGLHIAGNETADGSPAYIYTVKSFNGTRNVLLNYHAASGSGTYVGGINMTNTATSFPTSSDERLKKNIVDAPSAGDKIDAMQVRSFNWKVDDSFQEYGLIAQELQSVYDLPVEHHDTEDTFTVDYSKLVPVLLKEIQDLRKRVATLENN